MINVLLVKIDTKELNKKPMEEDLLKVEIEIELNEFKQIQNFFGLIKNTEILIPTDRRILPQIKIENQDNEKKVLEIIILIRKLNYTTQTGSKIKIKVKIFKTSYNLLKILT